MKTTIDLPDDLVRELKIRAVREDRKLKDLVAELLRAGLQVEPGGEGQVSPRRMRFPLIEGTHPAKPEDEITPERLAEILLEQEADWALGR